MKIKKILLLVLVTVFTLFAAISCSEDLLLNQVLRVTTNINDASIQYTQNALTDEDGGVESLSVLSQEFSIITLSDTTNNFVLFNELRLEIIDLHEQLVSERELLRSHFRDIKDNVTTLKEMSFVLLDDDKTMIRGYIESLRTIKTNLIETKGDAYQRIYDLRGTYTRENLPDIIVVYQEVIEVLNYRLDMFGQAIEQLEDINIILLDYLEE